MRHFGLVAAVCGLMTASLIAAAPRCLATTWYVDAVNGNNGNSGTSPNAAFADPYQAASVVQAGDTIDIDGNGEVYSLTNESSGQPVTFNASGTSSSPITIQTTPGQSNAVLDATNTWQGTGDGVDLNGSYITLQNITVENANGDDVDIPNGSYDTVQNCIAEYAQWAGIMIGSTGTTSELYHDAVLGCNVHDNNQINVNGNGYNWAGSLVVSNCEYGNLQNNTVYHNWGEGIGMYSFGQTTAYNYIEDNTVGDNWSVECYIADSQYNYLWNNFIYADGNAPLRGGYPAIGIGSDNENPSVLDYGSQIFNNIVIGGYKCFRAANENTTSGFYPGGLNGYAICNNVFYGGSQGTVQIDQDPGNNEVFQNNIVWQTNDSQSIAYNGGGGSATISNNCWDGNGSNNMGGSGDVDLYNTNPGFVNPGSLTPTDWELTSGSPCNASGANDTSLLTFDYNWATRPSSGAWSMGAFVAASGGGPSFSGYYRLVNLSSSMALSTNNSSSAGTAVIQDTSNTGWWDQEWSVAQDGNGTYRFINLGSGMALDCGGSNSSGATLVEEPSSPGDSAQEWQLQSQGGGYYNLVNVYSGLAANTNNSNSAGTDVIQYANNAGWWDEEFQFVPD